MLHNKALVVLGMHRSGTSALTGLLARLGVDLGPRLMAGSDDNEAGFWEHLDIVNCHDELLAGLSLRWDDPCPLPVEWWHTPEAVRCREALTAILRRDFACSPLWGIKDPRICRLLPLWIPLLRELGVDPHFIIVTRHPEESAQSLARRNGFSTAKSHMLWLEHALGAELDTRGFSRAFVMYEDFLRHHRETMERLGSELRIDWPEQNPEDAMRDFIDPQKRHHRGGDLAALPPQVRMTYEAMLHFVAGRLDEAQHLLDPLHQALGGLRPLFGAQLRERGVDLQQQIDEQHGMLTWQISVLQDKNRGLDNERLAQMGRVKHREEKITTLETKIETLKSKVEDYKQRTDEAHGNLQAMRDSWGWTFSKPVRVLEKAIGLAPARSVTKPARKSEKRKPEDNGVQGTPPVRESTVPQSVLADPPAPPAGDAKAWMSAANAGALNAFLASGHRMKFASNSKPVVSVLLVLFNRAELTFACLRSLREIARVSFELVIVDNASTDATSMLLERLDGAVIHHNAQNVHFLEGANQAARAASGTYLLFLNNDAQLLPGAVEAAVECIVSAPDIGAVGARIILPDGRLQEAGSIVWSDGSCAGYGRGGDPAASEFQFRRDVDFCSGAFLLTPRNVFEECGGFSEIYKPAYYEEVDYCMRLWARGLRVVYEPRATILHYEFASSSEPAKAVDLQRRNHGVFQRAHAEALKNHLPPANANVLAARSRNRGSSRILLIEDRVPHQHLGSGFPRSNALLHTLQELGHAVTLFPFWSLTTEWAGVYQDLPRELEVIIGSRKEELPAFLRERQGFYDFIIVSRPHNMRFFRTLLSEEIIGRARVIYDAEAVFSMRAVTKAELEGAPLDVAAQDALLAEETALCAGAHALVSVSEHEKNVLEKHSGLRCAVLSHRIENAESTAPFASRHGLLFAGAVHEEDSPNADSLLWFGREVFPLVREKLNVVLTVAGPNDSEKIRAFEDASLRFAGAVPDLNPFYNKARVFIAPTRFAAGIPIKVLDAAAHGVPVVATPLLARQLGWKDGVELLVAGSASEFAAKCVALHEDPELWEKIRDGALAAVQRDCSAERFAQGVKEALELAR